MYVFGIATLGNGSWRKCIDAPNCEMSSQYFRIAAWNRSWAPGHRSFLAWYSNRLHVIANSSTCIAVAEKFLQRFRAR